jgi:uncharacterized membrane protein (Fun14 family)
MASSTSYYSYTDATGVEVIVQRFADVPPQYRDQAKHIDLSKPAINLPVDFGENAKAMPSDALGAGKGTSLHVPSFVIGAGTALVLGLVAMLAFRRANRFLTLVVGVGVMAALGIGYMTYARRQAGLRGVGLATPATLLDDAREAASALNKRQVEQDRTLNEVDKQR